MQAMSTFSSRAEAASTERVVTFVAVIRLMEYRGPLYFFIFIGSARLSNFPASLFFRVSKSMMHYHPKISSRLRQPPESWRFFASLFSLLFYPFFQEHILSPTMHARILTKKYIQPKKGTEDFTCKRILNQATFTAYTVGFNSGCTEILCVS